MLEASSATAKTPGGGARLQDERQVRGLEGVPRIPAETDGGHDDDHVDRTGQGQGHHDVPPRGAHLTAYLLRAGLLHVLSEPGMQVDDVRHHRRSDNARGQVGTVRTVQARDQTGGHLADADRRRHSLVGERQDDDEQQREHHRHKAVPPTHPQHQDDEHDSNHDQATRKQRKVKQQPERDGPTDELGQIRHDHHELGLQPQRDAGTRTEALPAQLGQAGAGGDAQLRRQVLHHHGQHAGQHDHPDEQGAVLGPGAHVGGEVARVDVGDRGDERRPEHSEHRFDPSPMRRRARRRT